MKKIFYIISVAVVLASCSKDSDDGSGCFEHLPIVFSSSIEANMRAITNDATQFAAGDKIGITAYRADAVGVTTDFSSPFLHNMEFSYGSNKFTPTANNANAYWQLGKVHNFYAYYPSTLTINALTTLAPTATLTVATTTGLDDDVMHAKVENYAKFTGIAGNMAQLNFTHSLSKVRFKVLKEKSTDTNPVLKNIEFKMAHNSGIYNVATGDVNLGGSTVTLNKTMNQTVISTTAADVDAEWIVLPGDDMSDIKLTVGTKMLTATITGGAIITAVGKITVITLTVKPSGVEFTSSTVEDWGASSGSGEVIPLSAVVGLYYSDRTL